MNDKIKEKKVSDCCKAEIIVSGGQGYPLEVNVLNAFSGAK